MFLILSLTVSGSVLTLVILLLRHFFSRRHIGIAQWVWLIVLLRLCIPLPGPVNLVGGYFQHLQAAACENYNQAEVDWIIQDGKPVVMERITAFSESLSEEELRAPYGTVDSGAALRLPIPFSLRVKNPNTWFVVWAIGSAVCLLWSIFYYRRRPLRFKWFTVVVLSLHWFNPLMLCIRRDLGTPAPKKHLNTNRAIEAVLFSGLAVLGIALGAVPGGTGLDLFWGAERYVFQIGADAVTGKSDFDSFLAKTECQMTASLQVILYFPQDQFVDATIYIRNVYYDGYLFNMTEVGTGEDPTKRSYQFSCLIREEESAPEGSPVQSSVHFLLVDDPSVKWEDIWRQSFIRADEPIKFGELFTDLIYK